VGEHLIEVKADREYRRALDLPETVAFDRKRLYFFDTKGGQRLR